MVGKYCDLVRQSIIKILSKCMNDGDDKENEIMMACMGTLSCGRFLLIYRHWVSELFTKTLIIISSSQTSIYPMSGTL